MHLPGRISLSRTLLSTLGLCLVLGSESAVSAATFLFDFGAPDSLSGEAVSSTPEHWNNLTASQGAAEGTELPFLIDRQGNETPVSLQIVSRFNGANESGATSGGPYAPTATRDSLFGNTELFGSLENITPQFKLYGLQPGAVVSLTFYASRLGVSDNRETRYTVTGAATAFVDLDAGNNLTNTVRLTGVAADAAGEVLVELSPGPNNNNANHFTYLGVLQVALADGRELLIDLGAAGSLTEVQEPKPSVAWNNVPTALGTDATAKLADLVTTNGTATTLALQMIARFNGANLNGTTEPTRFPTTATRDSLFGNTTSFGGLENVFPAFKLTGLSQDQRYSFTFYGSRTGVSDNRETRYTVRGAAESFADLNTANNINAVAEVKDVVPDAAGEITVALSAGPNNSNGNRFTYLGVMQVDSVPSVPPTLLIDFGAEGSQTAAGSPGVELTWNNVPPSVGGNDQGIVTNLVRADGLATSVALQMVSRFNGANENGISDTGPFPTTATRDSLFGNTELFSGLENVTPIFRLTGLNPGTAYTLDFYGSRMGVGDNRETRYTATGALEKTVDLDIANNEANVATIADFRPDSAGEIRIALSPGPNNDNGNHFIYLGVLRLTWTSSAPPTPATLDQPRWAADVFRFRLTGTAGATYRIQGAVDLGQWSDVQSVTLSGTSATAEIPATGNWRFFRAIAIP